jgi:hypothetical protein
MQCAETTHHMTHHMFQVGGFRWVVGVEPLAVGGTIANDRRSQNPEITTSPRPGPPCPQKCADGLPSGHTPLSLQGDDLRCVISQAAKKSATFVNAPTNAWQ